MFAYNFLIDYYRMRHAACDASAQASSVLGVWGGRGVRQRECDSILEAHKQTRQVDTKVKQEQGQREGQGECKEPSGNLAKRNAI